MSTTKKEGNIVYFSLEAGLKSDLPTYAGGLGVLAGDTIKSCADLNVPLVAVTLLNREGYFHQELDEFGNQKEVPVKWDPNQFMTPLNEKVMVQIEGRDVYIKAWKYLVEGVNGHIVDVLFLDTNLPENSEWDRNITNNLYGGDRWYRLCQEIILGIGGMKMVRALGYGDLDSIHKYHMNEGHAGFLTLELLNEIKECYPNRSQIFYEDFVKSKCVFTTHTPVPAGHDVFEENLVFNALREYCDFSKLSCFVDGKFNMTLLALENSGHVNGVAKKHGDVSRKMFPGFEIDSITNGVHSLTWTCDEFKKLYDTYIPGWRRDSYTLRYSLKIPKDEIWNAHQRRKKELLDYVKKEKGVDMDPNVLTIGFARRAASYKRSNLIFSDINRLKSIARRFNGIQIVMAGKAHPSDGIGKDMIKSIFSKIGELAPEVKVVYLQNYEMWLGQLMTSGVDVWLNTPQRPKEASGTSGMKSAHNGVLNFSVLDGWWIEGHVEGVTGWSIGPGAEVECHSSVDSDDLYFKLESKILPLYIDYKEKWKEMMLHSISHNASFFNTQRMVSQYVLNSYFL